MGSSKDRSSVRSKHSMDNLVVPPVGGEREKTSAVTSRRSSLASRGGRRHHRRKALSSAPQARPPSKVSEILNKRTPFAKYDPASNVEEKAIGLLIENETQKGRLPNEEKRENKMDEKRARAFRHWEYLRHVALQIGANARALKMVREKQLMEEMEQRRQELERAEQEMLENERRMKEMKGEMSAPGGEESERDENGLSSAESVDSGVSSSETSGRKAQSLQIPTKSDSEMLMGRIVLRRGKSMNDLNCQLRAEDEQTTLLKNKFPENEDLLLSLQFAHQSKPKRVKKPQKSTENVDLPDMGACGLLPETPGPLFRTRSVFAAPAWDPNDPESLERIHKELMEIPLCFPFKERGIDVPEDLEEQDASTDSRQNEHRFAFKAPSKQTVEKEKEPKQEEAEERESGKAESVQDGIPFMAEEAPTVQSANDYNDLAEEYARRRAHVERKKEQLERLQQKAIRFKEETEKQERFVKSQRKLLPGFSVMPENYTGKIVLNVVYGNNNLVPLSHRISNPKHQLYCSVTHLFDFSRVEVLNKKKPRVAFLLRPFDKSFPYPKGANKYREVELNRKTGQVSAGQACVTFEVKPETLMRRWLFIRVKAYKGIYASDFLGQVKIDFTEYERAQELQIVDNEAYLYGKFSCMGTLDVEMFYKTQQGCLNLTVHSANIFPTADSPGDTYVKIYHKYMGRLVETLHTAVQKETFMPEYQETFTLKLPKGMIDESLLHFRLMSKPAVTFISDSVRGEVFLAERTSCDEWNLFYTNSLMHHNPKPTRATLPLMSYKV